jgi:L-threonylcarbamoyladenylate synthase
MFSSESIDAIRQGKIGVIPTDTLYGLSASTDFPESIERLYQLRGRDTGKPFIILIADVADLARFGISLTQWQRAKLAQLWPGRVSVVLSCVSEQYSYLHRGTDSLSFRVPDDEALRDFLRLTGPIVSTSVNPQGLTPATTLEEARGYFGEQLDFTVDVGRLESEPSTVVSLEGDRVTVLRPGAVEVS